MHREALSLRPPGHSDRSDSLNNLAVDLRSRFEQTGQRQNLEEAIELDREALSLLPPGHSDRSGSLNSLANELHSRFGQTGQLQDLEEAIELYREALSLQPLVILIGPAPSTTLQLACGLVSSRQGSYRIGTKR